MRHLIVRVVKRESIFIHTTPLTKILARVFIFYTDFCFSIQYTIHFFLDMSGSAMGIIVNAYLKNYKVLNFG